jgi:hypothetical protein
MASFSVVNTRNVAMTAYTSVEEALLHASLLVSTQETTNTAMTSGANNDATKPPPATRHSAAVMTLQKTVLLYNMWLHTLLCLHTPHK